MRFMLRKYYPTIGFNEMSDRLTADILIEKVYKKKALVYGQVAV